MPIREEKPANFHENKAMLCATRGSCSCIRIMQRSSDSGVCAVSRLHSFHTDWRRFNASLTEGFSAGDAAFQHDHQWHIELSLDLSYSHKTNTPPVETVFAWFSLFLYLPSSLISGSACLFTQRGRPVKAAWPNTRSAWMTFRLM